MIAKIEQPDGGAALQVLEGRYGPYVTDGETNASVPKGTDPATLSLDDALALLEARRGAAPWAASRRGAPAPAREARDSRRAAVDGDGQRGPGQEGQGHGQDREDRRARANAQSLMVRIIGGGLAGCEAAWQVASRGVPVTLHEMRPVRPTAVHKTDRLAELVCSNSFRGDKLDNAVGLLKEEMRRLGSLVMRVAEDSRVPAGAALAVDRERFSQVSPTPSPRIRSSPSSATRC